MKLYNPIPYILGASMLFTLVFSSCAEEPKEEPVSVPLVIEEEEIDTLEPIKQDIYDNYASLVVNKEYDNIEKRTVGLEKVKYYYREDKLQLIISSRESSEHPVWRFYLKDEKLSYVSKKYYEQPLDYSEPIPDPTEVIWYFHYDQAIYKERPDDESVTLESDTSASQILTDFKAYEAAILN